MEVERPCGQRGWRWSPEETRMPGCSRSEPWVKRGSPVHLQSLEKMLHTVPGVWQSRSMASYQIILTLGKTADASHFKVKSSCKVTLVLRKKCQAGIAIGHWNPGLLMAKKWKWCCCLCHQPPAQEQFWGRRRVGARVDKKPTWFPSPELLEAGHWFHPVQRQCTAGSCFSCNLKWTLGWETLFGSPLQPPKTVVNWLLRIFISCT